MNMDINLLLNDTGSELCNSKLLYTYNFAVSKSVSKIDRKFVFDLLADYKQNHSNLNTLIGFKKGLFYGLKKICVRNKLQSEFEKIKTVFQEFRYKSPGRVYYNEDYLTLPELAKAMKTANPKEAVFLEILAISGMRLNEMLSIKYSDIRTQKNRAIIILRKTKNKQKRAIILPLKIIIKVKKVFNSKIYLFENVFGRKYTDRAVQKHFSNISKRIGKRVTPHLMRHWFINQRAEEASLFEIHSLASYVGNTFNILVKHYLSGKFKESRTYQPVKRKLDREIKRQKKGRLRG